MESAADVLRKFLETHNLDGGEKYVSFFSGWEKLVGTDLAAHSTVVDIRNGAAVVEIDHPGWMQIFQMNQASILKRIQRGHPDLEIRHLHMRLVDRVSQQRSKTTYKWTEVSKAAAGSESDSNSRPDTTESIESERRSEGLERIPPGRLRDLLNRLREDLETDE